MKQTDWSDFRDHLATADKEGRRMWLFPKKPRGKFYQRRTWLTWILLAVMFGGPFVKINGNPLLMVNIVERKFSVLGVIFWPQESSNFEYVVTEEHPGGTSLLPHYLEEKKVKEP